jgi:hypothetical protein
MIKEPKRFKDNPSDLAMYTGTEKYYKNSSLIGLRYTDGIKHMAESRDAYWLIQMAYNYSRFIPKLAKEPFVTIELSVDGDEAELVFTDGNDNILHVEDIPYTDYPDEGVCLWLIDGVLLLPSEY